MAIAPIYGDIFTYNRIARNEVDADGNATGPLATSAFDAPNDMDYIPDGGNAEALAAANATLTGVGEQLSQTERATVETELSTLQAQPVITTADQTRINELEAIIVADDAFVAGAAGDLSPEDLNNQGFGLSFDYNPITRP
jgi:hypothetical protein